MHNRQSVYRLTIRALLTALIIVQTMTIGFIPLGFTSLTVIHITVIVAAIVLGPWDGMFIGLMWGLFTIIRALTAPTTPLDPIIFTNPIVAVVPRVLVGLVAGVTFNALRKRLHTVGASIVAAALGTLTNTILVIALMGTLYTGTVAKAYGVTSSGLLKVLMGVIAANGVPEVLGAVILTPIIVSALFSVRRLHLRRD
ncbi:ECF transporter S component [Lacticaseibacillus parakribbianus]|uniref:ECF transporter S component n=1 Tax=Lacticaseibacillus parakribbianus TaxID=2970927 RepID=UPI0021CAFD43|nr:ECF transporter S component [Lacticaseibacillus parakribbianus]